MRAKAVTSLLAFIGVAFAAAPPSVNPGDALIRAAKAHDPEQVEALVKAGANVNSDGPDGSTALHWAVHWDDVAPAKRLIDAGAEADAANRFGVTPLMLAAKNGNSEMLELLLDSGANPNASQAEGETVLMTAARTGRADALRTLLSRGAEVNAREAWRGQTALMWSAGEGHLDAVKTLLKAGADVSAKSKAGYSALLFAARQGHIEVTRALLDAGADVDESLPLKRPGGWAAADETESARKGAGVLEVAVSNAHFEIAAMLLDRGADPNASGLGWTALHTISWVRKPGIGSNEPPPEGSGKVDSLEMVRQLVAHGADINFQMTSATSPGKHSLNTIGATPYLAACRTADVELMRLLHELGADPLIPNENGTTPLMVAAGVGVRNPLEDAGRPDEVAEAVKVALELGGDPNFVDSHQDTAMHGAAYKHSPGAVRALVEGGAKIELWNRKNHLGWTPLRIATGVHRGMNFRDSPETAAVLAEVMDAAGVSTEVEPLEFISGATK